MYGYGYGYGYPMFDPTMILVLIGVVLSMLASAKVQSTFSKYSRVRSMTGMTGAEAAQRLLNHNGIYDVRICRVSGNLTDHYNPATKTLNLSESVYDSVSVAAIGVAAHECGHAIQDAQSYAPLKLRGAIVPVVNIGANLSWPMIMMGVIFGGLGSPLIQIGILLFSLSVVFQLVTLPVEFNASSRAIRLLDEMGILRGEEVGYTRKVLGAAALTYVAAAAGSILQLLRLVILFGVEIMTVKGSPVREIILEVLTEVLEKGQYSHLVLSQALSKYQYLEKADRSFIKRVSDGTIEYLIQIDYILNSYSKIKVNKMKPIIRTILRMSVYQICYMDRVPDSAACNEAVKLAEKRGFRNLKGFVNGILRNVARGKDSLTFPNDSALYSMPEWILELWSKSYEKETIRRMASSFLGERPLMVRLNQTKAAPETIRVSLEEQGISIQESEYSPDVWILSGIDYLEGVEAFLKGWIQVQDLSSSLSGDAAGIRGGEYVIDVCAAPGGKSLHIADLLKGTGTVVVRDISDRKVAMIEENIERAGFKNMRAEVFDALEFDPESEKKADVVIADLPCSGLGIIGRKPDIKYNMTLEKTEELAKLQREMLSVVSRYVKPGGILVYSTCTIDRKENEDNRNWFLENFPFKPVNIEGRLGTALSDDTMKDGYIQLLPGIHPCDGFFIAVMKRNEEE